MRGKLFYLIDSQISGDGTPLYTVANPDTAEVYRDVRMLIGGGSPERGTYTGSGRGRPADVASMDDVLSSPRAFVVRSAAGVRLIVGFLDETGKYRDREDVETEDGVPKEPLFTHKDMYAWQGSNFVSFDAQGVVTAKAPRINVQGKLRVFNGDNSGEGVLLAGPTYASISNLHKFAAEVSAWSTAINLAFAGLSLTESAAKSIAASASPPSPPSIQPQAVLESKYVSVPNNLDAGEGSENG